jgi:SH3 domain protein
VRGGLRLNLRTEPGTQYRILGVLETGDGVEVLKRNKEWTKVRGPDGKQGWIPKGYLRSDPPPAIRLEQVEAELASLRARVEKSDAAVRELETRNDELSTRDGDQLSTIEQLSAENSDLKKSRRWPEWVTGASVLIAGMLLGSILHRNATRRPSARIRL